MNKIAMMALTAACVFGMTACGESHTTTTVKKETKTNEDGSTKTKIETKTETITEPENKTRVEVKKDDPIVKLGPVEIRTD